MSYLAAARLARRIGLINTMVLTHLPANLCLVAVPFATGLWQAIALLLLRSLLAQMDVPTRTSYVMAVVTPVERQAAASLTAVPRSLVAALSPSLAGWMLGAATFAWPLLLAGAFQDRLRPRAARPLPAYPSARGAAAVITAGKDAVRPRVPRGHKLAAVGRDDPFAPAAAPKTQTV